MFAAQLNCNWVARISRAGVCDALVALLVLQFLCCSVSDAYGQPPSFLLTGEDLSSCDVHTCKDCIVAPFRLEADEITQVNGQDVIKSTRSCWVLVAPLGTKETLKESHKLYGPVYERSVISRSARINWQNSSMPEMSFRDCRTLVKSIPTGEDNLFSQELLELDKSPAWKVIGRHRQCPFRLGEATIMSENRRYVVDISKDKARIYDSWQDAFVENTWLTGVCERLTKETSLARYQRILSDDLKHLAIARENLNHSTAADNKSIYFDFPNTDGTPIPEYLHELERPHFSNGKLFVVCKEKDQLRIKDATLKTIAVHKLGPDLSWVGLSSFSFCTNIGDARYVDFVQAPIATAQTRGEGQMLRVLRWDFVDDTIWQSSMNVMDEIEHTRDDVRVWPKHPLAIQPAAQEKE